MKPRSAGLLAGLLFVIVGGCGDAGSPTTVPATTPPTTATTSPPTSASPETTVVTTIQASTTVPTTAPPTTSPATTVADTATIVQVSYRGGEVTIESNRVAVSVGDEVEIIVSADVDDELHVHGYDLFAQVTAGDAASLRFEADIPGIFEVELEDAGVELFSLEVS